MAFIICARDGSARVARREEARCLTLARGKRRNLEKLLLGQARHAYDGTTLLVPGIPEADCEEAALQAAIAFGGRLTRALARQA